MSQVVFVSPRTLHFQPSKANPPNSTHRRQRSPSLTVRAPKTLLEQDGPTSPDSDASGRQLTLLTLSQILLILQLSTQHGSAIRYPDKRRTNFTQHSYSPEPTSAFRSDPCRFLLLTESAHTELQKPLKVCCCALGSQIQQFLIFRIHKLSNFAQPFQ